MIVYSFQLYRKFGKTAQFLLILHIISDVLNIGLSIGYKISRSSCTECLVHKAAMQRANRILKVLIINPQIGAYFTISLWMVLVGGSESLRQYLKEQISPNPSSFLFLPFPPPLLCYKVGSFVFHKLPGCSASPSHGEEQWGQRTMGLNQ